MCEAASRPHMLFVAVKSTEQQALLLAHAFRQGTIEARTALVNRVRGALLEFGIAVPQGIEQLRAALPLLLEPTAALAQRLPGTLRTLLEQALGHWAELDARIDQAEAPITQHAGEDAGARMVGKLEGIGPLGASALVAHLGAYLGDMSMFTHARQASAWLGVVPAQHSSGGKVKLSGISKHGVPALRTLLITGARSAVQTAHLRTDPTSQWLTRLRERSGWQAACVALPNRFTATRPSQCH